MEKVKRTRRTKEEMALLRNANITATLKINTVEAPKNIDEGDSDGEDFNDASGKAFFFISDGAEQLRVKAFKGFWAVQRFSAHFNHKEQKEEQNWVSFKYLTDLGSVANRIFDFRLKNAEASTLKELSVAAKQIGEDIRKEFALMKGLIK